MSALRQNAAGVIRRCRLTAPTLRNVRTYASEFHGHGHHAPAAPVDEPLGSAVYIAVGAVFASVFVYTVSRPGEDGKPRLLNSLWNRMEAMREQDQERNALRTAVFEQAAHDKHLLYYAPRSDHIELKYPEQFGHGSPFNVPAGHYANIDHVVAHYREKHLKEEERKAKKLAAEKQLS
ncbi:hypothetical protein VTK73DRAFT_5278 [Phialemonium thermophilum]|uniref:Uncharacterized protein n=1 Tax=Phialemonium thermophilum TaxID=223376 RepID=A0ABR3WPU2_9PEZI